MIARPLMASLAVCALAMSGGAQAENGSPPIAEFSAKRVKPPEKGVKRRITVQIDPEEAPLVVAARPAADNAADGAAAVPSTDSPGRYGWFWDRVSPDLDMSGPGRLDAALTAISSSGPVAAPRLQTLRDIAATRAIPILTSTVGTRVSPALVLAVIAVESAGRADAVSPVGAQGLMQLMPATAQQFDVSDSLVPEQNIAGGVKYLDWLMREFEGDPILVLAGYNAGPGAVRNHGGVPPYPETRDYVPKVLAAFQVARALCRTPPELISDGCVFATVN